MNLFFSVCVFVSVVVATLGQTPIGQQAPTPTGPWSEVAGTLSDLGESSYSLQIPITFDQMYFRLLFPEGGGLVQATQLNLQPEGLVIHYAPAIQPLVETVFVEGGTFLMGDEWWDNDQSEHPVHSVTVSSFSMSKYEVTNEQVREVMQVTATSSTVRNAQGYAQELLDLDASHCQISWNDSSFVVHTGKEDYPCLEVTWYGSVAFCNFLSEMEDLMLCYNLNTWECDWNAQGYRLPTEAEWEYAAKGGLNGNKTEYAGSDTIDAVAWCRGNSGYESHEVGTKVGNELGIHDMSGNVGEWCWDWLGLDYYSSSPSIDPRGPVSGNFRVERGGSWGNYAWSCRVANRGYVNPDYSSHDLGFRLARTVPGR